MGAYPKLCKCAESFLKAFVEIEMLMGSSGRKKGQAYNTSIRLLGGRQGLLIHRLELRKLFIISRGT